MLDKQYIQCNLHYTRIHTCMIIAICKPTSDTKGYACLSLSTNELEELPQIIPQSSCCSLQHSTLCNSLAIPCRIIYCVWGMLNKPIYSYIYIIMHIHYIMHTHYFYIMHTHCLYIMYTHYMYIVHNNQNHCCASLLCTLDACLSEPVHAKSLKLKSCHISHLSPFQLWLQLPTCTCGSTRGIHPVSQTLSYILMHNMSITLPPTSLASMALCTWHAALTRHFTVFVPQIKLHLYIMSFHTDIQIVERYKF